MKLEDTLLWLCQVPSPIGEEKQLCTEVTTRLSAKTPAAPIRRYGDSIVVPIWRGSGGPHIGLLGHLDVVRTVHDAPARIEGDRLYGAGAADMKSGLALMLDLAEAKPIEGVDLTLVFYAREEGPFVENELGVVLEEDAELRKVDFAVALEPSDNKLQLGCGGSVHATVRFHGRTSHSARPWQGENAIHKAAGLLARLGELPPEQIEVDGLKWANVTSATLASGGRGRNIIPDVFELNVNRRFGPDRDMKQVLSEMAALFGDEAEVEFTDESPAAPPLATHPMVQALSGAGVTCVEPKQAWTDVARFAALGIPAVNFGPGVQAQAHQRNEWTLIPPLYVGRQILARWLAEVANL